MSERGRNHVFGCELVGMIFIIFLESVPHFTFDWFDHRPIAGVISTVNESIWKPNFQERKYAENQT